MKLKRYLLKSISPQTSNRIAMLSSYTLYIMSSYKKVKEILSTPSVPNYRLF
jgi:hypothetical protein